MKKILKKHNNIIIYLIVIIVLLLVFNIIDHTFGYYFHKNQSDGHVVSSNFYFDSDYLKEEGKVYNLNVGTTSITFELRNFADSLRYTENDVNYEVTITNNCKIEVSNATDYDDSDSKIVSSLKGGSKQSHIITVTGLENGKEYTVTATSKSGYKKTVSATFRVRETENNFYQNVSENEPYICLVIWTENVSGNVTIEFPDGLIPDNTCAGMEDVLTDSGKFTIYCGAYTSYEFRFFKDVSYSGINSFNVTLKTVQNEDIVAIKK